MRELKSYVTWVWSSSGYCWYYWFSSDCTALWRLLLSSQLPPQSSFACSEFDLQNQHILGGVSAAQQRENLKWIDSWMELNLHKATLIHSPLLTFPSYIPFSTSTFLFHMLYWHSTLLSKQRILKFSSVKFTHDIGESSSDYKLIDRRCCVKNCGFIGHVSFLFCEFLWDRQYFIVVAGRALTFWNDLLSDIGFLEKKWLELQDINMLS